jgi:hypothetical protein
MPVQMKIANHPALKAVPGILNAMNVGRWSSWSEFCASMTPEEWSTSAKKAWETRYGKCPEARAAWERMMLDFKLELIDDLVLVDPETLSAAQTQLYEHAKVTEDLVVLRSVCTSTLCLKEQIKRAERAVGKAEGAAEKAELQKVVDNLKARHARMSEKSGRRSYYWSSPGGKLKSANESLPKAETGLAALQELAEGGRMVNCLRLPRKSDRKLRPPLRQQHRCMRK